jgi:hypothetical protein
MSAFLGTPFPRSLYFSGPGLGIYQKLRREMVKGSIQRKYEPMNLSGFPYPSTQYLLPVFIFHCSYTMPGNWVDSKPELVRHVNSVKGGNLANAKYVAFL